MKKIEIMKLIEAKRIIKSNKKILSITKNHLGKIDKEYWFPDIKDLEEEFKILNDEVETALEETNKANEYIQSCNCTHEVRLKHFNLFSHHSTCIFCSKSIDSDNITNFEYSNNRNKYCVKLVAKYQANEEYDDITTGYTEEDIYEIILNILKNKDDNEEIDLVQELKKLNLANCEINEERKNSEHYILVIGGTNKGLLHKECIELINKSNGIPVLAHPKTLKLSEKEFLILLKEMISEGLKGIEVYHSTHTTEDIKFFLDIANKYNLLISGGSDFHGKTVKPDINLGTGRNNNLKIKSLSLVDYIREKNKN